MSLYCNHNHTIFILCYYDNQFQKSAMLFKFVSIIEQIKNLYKMCGKEVWLWAAFLTDVAMITVVAGFFG